MSVDMLINEVMFGVLAVLGLEWNDDKMLKTF